MTHSDTDALARIERALARIESAAARLHTASNDDERYTALRRRTKAALDSLEAVIAKAQGVR